MMSMRISSGKSFNVVVGSLLFDLVLVGFDFSFSGRILIPKLSTAGLKIRVLLASWDPGFILLWLNPHP